MAQLALRQRIALDSGASQYAMGDGERGWGTLPRSSEALEPRPMEFCFLYFFFIFSLLETECSWAELHSPGLVFLKFYNMVFLNY